jgi:hypothetical protein
MVQERRQAQIGCQYWAIILSSERRYPGKIEGRSKSDNDLSQSTADEETMRMPTGNRRPTMPRSLGVRLDIGQQVTSSDAPLQAGSTRNWP